MPWLDKVSAVLEAYLGGQAVGIATLKVLYGDVNPSGHLAETFPKKLQDNPSYLFFGGEARGTEYREGVFVGYRYYDKKEMEVLFPFGHGLSYTTFEYSDIKVSGKDIKDTDTVTVTVTVKNTGNRAGKVVAQLYVGDVESDIIRPLRELKGFAKTELQPGESKDVSFTLDKRSFAVWNDQIHDWYVESGDFTIQVGNSSRDLPLCETIHVTSTTDIPRKYSMDTIFMDLMKDEKAKAAFGPLMEQIGKVFGAGSEQEHSDAAQEAITEDMTMALMNYTPLRGLLSFGGDGKTAALIEELIEKLNG
mgnify:CR=1 FL=1